MTIINGLLEVSWTQWKLYAARSGVVTYYTVVGGSSYDAIAIDPHFIYHVILQATGDITDFNTNYLSGATLVGSVDEAVATANKLDAHNAIVYDGNNNPLSVQQGTAVPSTQGAMLSGGTDGTNARIILVDSAGRQKINNFDGSGNALTSTSNKLDVGLTGANTVKLNDSAGTAITLNTGGSLKNTIYDAAGNVAVGTKGSAFPSTAGVIIVGGTDGTNAQAIATDTSGRVKINNFDGSGNALTSTSSALDINLKTSSINLPISIAAQTLTAVVVSATSAANTVSNPIFVELSNGAAAFGTSSAPVFVNLKDGSGNALTSTSSKLDVGLTGANTVKLNDSAGTAITLNTGGSLKNTLYDAAGNVAIGTKGSAFPGTAGVVIVGGTDGTNAQAIATDTSGRIKVINFDGSGTALTSTSGVLNVGITGANVVKLNDGSGNAITSTSSALDVNLKTSSINIPVSIAAQTLTAVVVSATSAANTVSNPIFVELSNGAAAFGTSSAPVFVNLKDGSGNALTSTSSKLDVGLTGANTVKLNDSAGTAITLSGSNLQTSLFDSAGDAAVVKDAVATPANRGVVMVAGNDGTNIRLFATDTSGRVKVNNFDGSGNALTSTSSALDINLKTSSINLPISIAAQTLAAVAVSATNAANTVSNPIFVELSNGTAAFGTTSNPVFVNIKDGSGNALTSTSSKLDVGLTGANTVKLNDSAGTAITLNTGGSLKDTIYDAAGNAAVSTDGATFPVTAGVVIVGGTDNTHTQAIAVDSTGKTKIVLYDNQGNLLAPQTGTAVPGDQGGIYIAGSDGAGARIIATDTSGRQKVNNFDGSGNALTSTSSALDINIKTSSINVPVSIYNRDSTLAETVHGQIKIAEENVVNAANWVYQIFQEEVQRYVEGQGTFSFVNGALHLDASTPIGRVRIYGLRRMRYMPGVGVHVMMSVRFSDTGSSGCVRTWGAMDVLGLNGYLFQLNGTTLQISRRVNGTDNTTAATSWNVNNAVIADTNFHTWEILYQWLGSGRVIFRQDGKDVHTIEYAGTSSTLSTQNPDMVPWAEIQNTSTQGSDRYLEVGSYHLSHENSNSRQAMAIVGVAGNFAVPATLTNGTETGVLAIQFRSTKGSGAIVNQGVACVKKITISAQGSTTTTMDILIKKNTLFGGSIVWVAHKKVNDPNTEWNNAVQLTAVASASASTGAGYGATTNLAYKITAVGAIGETIPSTTSATVASGNPAKQINLAWSPVTYASAYNIYRQNAGAGNYSLIGTSSGLSFTDNAFLSSATVPPGSSTAEGETFMQFISPLASGAAGFTSTTGRVVMAIRLLANFTWTQTFESGELMLNPGESITITATANAAGQNVTGNIEWEEGPTIER